MYPLFSSVDMMIYDLHVSPFMKEFGMQNVVICVCVMEGGVILYPLFCSVDMQMMMMMIYDYSI